MEGGVFLKTGHRAILCILIFIIAITAFLPSTMAARGGKGQLKNLSFTIATDKPEYQLGETVFVTLTLTNIGKKKDITIMYGDSKFFDFTVRIPVNSSYEIIYRWSYDKYFFQLVTVVTLHPGDSFGQTLEWPQTDFDKKQVGPETYYISGETLFILEPSGKLTLLRTQILSIQIVD